MKATMPVSRLPARLLSRSTVLTLLVAWAVTVGVMAGHGVVANPATSAVAIGIFALILAAIMVAAFGVVRQAERLAHLFGEPFGTLILTLTVVVIEVVLISSVMLGPSASTTIGRDSLFAVMMVIINGVLGLALLLGALRHGPQAFNREGASVYVAIIAALSLCTLVLPNFTTSTSDGTLVPVQAVGLTVLAVALYAFFLHVQTGRGRELFVQRPATAVTRAPVPRREVIQRALLLVATVLPIVLLSHDLGVLVDLGIVETGAPPVLGGVIIAIIVFAPEAITAVRASLANETQRTLNLGLGAFVSTVGLTIPAILVIGLVTGQEVVLGESPANMVLIAVTVLMTAVTFTSPRTTALHGAVHLMLFGVFAILLFAP
ncbi:MAG: calcium:proton antiporter [Burkholderiaceae bacterium]|nr:calcium:proton antiporter [Microbacteriaceae bacterium]